MSHATAGAPRRALDLARDGPAHLGLPSLRRPAPRLRPVSVVPRPPHRRGTQGSRRAAALLAPGARRRGRGQGGERRRRDADGLGQDALLQPAGPAGPGRAARGARPLPVSDQGARPGPARGAERARQDPARHADVHVRRRHAAGRAALGARSRQPRADQPRHAALGHPAAPHEVGEPLPEPPLRRHRRAARVPRGLRQPSRQRVAPAQAHLPPLRQRAAVHHGLGDHRQPARAGRALDRGAGVGGRGERRADGGESLPLLQPARGQSGARHPRAVSRRGGQARRALSQEADRHDRLRPEPARHRGLARHDQARGRGQDGRLRDGARIPGRLPAAAPARGRAGAPRRAR